MSQRKQSVTKENVLAFLLHVYQNTPPGVYLNGSVTKVAKTFKITNAYLVSVLAERGILEIKGNRTNQVFRYCSEIHPNLHMSEKIAVKTLEKQRENKEAYTKRKQTEKQMLDRGRRDENPQKVFRREIKEIIDVSPTAVNVVRRWQGNELEPPIVTELQKERDRLYIEWDETGKKIDAIDILLKHYKKPAGNQ